MSVDMGALVYQGPFHVQVMDMPDPKIAIPGQYS